LAGDTGETRAKLKAGQAKLATRADIEFKRRGATDERGRNFHEGRSGDGKAH
jgi:hypothetical protein